MSQPSESIVYFDNDKVSSHEGSKMDSFSQSNENEYEDEFDAL